MALDIKKLPKTEFAAAVVQIAGERGIDPTIVVESVREAILAAFKRDCRERGEEVDLEENEYEVDLNPDSGEIRVYLLDKGQRKDVTPPDFGRIATQTAKQVILQKIREAERDVIMDQFQTRIGGLVLGTVIRVDPQKVVVSVGKAEAIMPKEEQVRGEFYKLGDKLSFFLKEIKTIDEKKEIIVSRKDPGLVVELFRREVPEVSSGTVEVKGIARNSGERTKIAVISTQPGVDPIGSCVGQRGVRVQAVIKELGEKERIDVVLYNDNLEQFIANALSPAERVKVAEKKDNDVLVVVPDDKLALAIGDRGENVRLASELVGLEIKVISESEHLGIEAEKKPKKEKSKKKAKKE